MKGFKKLLVIVLCLVMGVGVMGTMTACGKTEVELTVFTMFGKGDDHNAPYEEVNKLYKAEYKNVGIDDISLTGATNAYDSVLETKFVHESTSPDVLYTFAPARNMAFKNNLAKVSDIVAKFPDYAKNVDLNSAPDEYTLPFKGITEGAQYDPQQYTDADFASPAALLAKVKANNTANTAFDSANKKAGSKAVNPIGEINYFGMWAMLDSMGDTLANCVDVNEEWIKANKTALIAGIENIKKFYTDAGFDGVATTVYGDEKDAMWNGNRSFIIDGSWNVLGFYGEEYGNKKIVDDSNAQKGIKVRNLPYSNNKSYVLAGFTHGWMINKNLLKEGNEKKLEAAVNYIRMHVENAQKYADATGGVYAVKDVAPAGANGMQKGFAGLIDISAKKVIPIDDKFTDIACKNAYFAGIKTMITAESTKTATQVVEDMLAAYKEA